MAFRGLVPSRCSIRNILCEQGKAVARQPIVLAYLLDQWPLPCRMLMLQKHLVPESRLSLFYVPHRRCPLHNFRTDLVPSLSCARVGSRSPSCSLDRSRRTTSPRVWKELLALHHQQTGLIMILTIGGRLGTLPCQANSKGRILLLLNRN